MRMRMRMAKMELMEMMMVSLKNGEALVMYVVFAKLYSGL